MDSSSRVQHMFWDTGFGMQANWSLPSGGAPWNSLTIGNSVRTGGPEPFLQRRGILREVRLPDSRGLQPSRRVPGRIEPDRPEQRADLHGGVWPARYECKLRHQQALLRVLRRHQPHVGVDASVRPLYRAVCSPLPRVSPATRSAFAWCCSRRRSPRAASSRERPLAAECSGGWAIKFFSRIARMRSAFAGVRSPKSPRT